MSDFSQQHQQGKRAEVFIYELFQEAFNIIPAPDWGQKEGWDFTFCDRVSGQQWKVELKTDSRAAATGNAFIETVSVDVRAVQGWATTSQADWLLYFLPNAMPPIIYRVAMELLRVELPSWARLYPTRRIPNRGYNTMGLLVPLAELQRVATEVIEL